MCLVKKTILFVYRMPKAKGVTRNYLEKLSNDSSMCKLCQKIIKIGGGTSNMLAKEITHRQRKWRVIMLK